MGKNGKKHKNHRGKTVTYISDDDEHPNYPFTPPPPPPPLDADGNPSDQEEEQENNEKPSNDKQNNNVPSKFSLYQQSVQSPNGDMSYLVKFFLMYVGGRLPLHLEEDFCGTALLSTEWLRSETRRTAVGLDLDVEALKWCIDNNLNKFGADGSSRISLFHGNVLQPLEAKLVECELHNLIKDIHIQGNEDVSEIETLNSTAKESLGSRTSYKLMKDSTLPSRDIVCAFNYSCCCLHNRQELVAYFKYALSSLSRKGGIFVMDLYGGKSSECELRLQRRFPNFTYIWEQAGFDIVQRKTRISLHYNLQKPQRKIRNAFSYSWRLWSLPEIRDCLEEVGFKSVHFWVRQMPDSENIRKMEGFGDGRDVKYEEVTSFQQQDSWNAYIVGVA